MYVLWAENGKVRMGAGTEIILLDWTFHPFLCLVDKTQFPLDVGDELRDNPLYAKWWATSPRKLHVPREYFISTAYHTGYPADAQLKIYARFGAGTAQRTISTITISTNEAAKSIPGSWLPELPETKITLTLPQSVEYKHSILVAAKEYGDA